MKCPICGGEMQAGGIVVEGVAAGWVPMEQFEKKGLKRFLYKGVRRIGNANVLLRQIKVPNAHYCPFCKKIIGVFDVTDA